MEKTFINDDFLLNTDEARELFHGYAEKQPIIDFHCHLDPKRIAEDERWENISEIWLDGDHYKWRMMRSAGIPERYCAGDASDREKFDKYAALMPKALRNPLYHWSHMELKRYFDVEKLLSPETADEIWSETSEIIQSPGFSARKLLERSNVEILCTTDDPVDTLEHHEAIANDDSFDVKVLPSWRPDNAWRIDDPDAFNQWTDRLAETADVDIRDLESFLGALRKRHDFFHERGCVVSDRGLETIYAENRAESEASAVFAAVRAGKTPSREDYRKFASFMLRELAIMDAEKGWATQLHYGALRNNNSKNLERLGPDTGFDSIGDWNVAAAMARHLDSLDKIGKLPKTIIYPINPSDNELVATMCGNFQDGETPGKMQLGSAWWFLDQLDGMARQIDAISNMGLLSHFVGMVTDSRSFLSYSRHEYFRRLLCRILGGEMAEGLIPYDMDLVGGMVGDICRENAKRYFDFPE